MSRKKRRTERDDLPDKDRETTIWAVVWAAGGVREIGGRSFSVKPRVDRCVGTDVPAWFNDQQGYPPTSAAYVVLDSFCKGNIATARAQSAWFLTLWAQKGEFANRNPHFGPEV